VAALRCCLIVHECFLWAVPLQYMTEGVLLRESLREPDLDQYR